MNDCKSTDLLRIIMPEPYFGGSRKTFFEDFARHLLVAIDHLCCRAVCRIGKFLLKNFYMQDWLTDVSKGGGTDIRSIKPQGEEK